MAVTGSMHERPMMDFSEAMTALDGMLTVSASSAESPLAVTIVNEDGDLVCYARMDKAPFYAEKESLELAQKARLYGVDLHIRSTDQHLALPTDLPRPSAVVVREMGVVIGAIGVSGGATSRNVQIARLGLELFATAAAMRSNK